MSYEPLHHKYRPQTFADLVGQSAITTTLCNALTTGRIAPAYLFTGPRGTGKTSSARILAKSLNCISSPGPTPTPCGKCDVCRSITSGSALDIIEIDAASNTGVDNIREIIDRSQFSPVQCRYKVYIIDEVHMLSTAAFNALLKTLEEPPDRVTFILATTDPQRVLPTIISRCQRFDYRRIPLEDMVSHLGKIASIENIAIEPAAVTLVAQIANGGLRDAESLLDQLSLLEGTITPDQIWDLVGAVPEKDLFKLLMAVRSQNPETIIEQCRHLMNRGKEPLTVLQNLAGFYLNLLLAKTSPGRPDLVPITAPTWEALCAEARSWSINDILQAQEHLKGSEAQIKHTTQPRLWLEITLMGLIGGSEPSTPPAPPKTTSIAPQTPEVKTTPPSGIPSVTEKTPPPPPAIVPFVKAEVVSTPREDNRNTGEIWDKVLEAIPLMATRTLLRQQGKLFSFSDSVAVIAFPSEKFLRLIRGKTDLIESAFESVCGKKVKVHIQVTGATLVTPPPPETQPESKEEEKEKPIIPSTPENGHQRSTPPPVEKPLPQIPQKKENVNNTDAATIFAKIFEGELVLTESVGVPTQPQITITNRPDISDISEEDLPF